MRVSRVLLSVLTLLSILLVMAVPAVAEELRVEDLPRVAVQIDGQLLDADAYIVNGRTVVPLRAIFTALGAEVGWDGATRTVTATKGTRVIKLTIDQTDAYVDGKPVTLSVPAMIIESRTFVPVRFVSEALDAQVSFNSETRTVIVETNVGCKLVGGQKHTGKITPGGETWALCGSPHIVSGTFTVEGDDNPVLNIEPGVLVTFEKNARLVVGNNGPGGLVVNGTEEKPVTMTSALAAPNAGDWKGIMFGQQTLQGFAALENVNIRYAGGTTGWDGAIYADTGKGELPVSLKRVEMKDSLGVGLRMSGGARLTEDSFNIMITGTKAGGEQAGYPVVTDITGLGSLPYSTNMTESNATTAVFINTRQDVARNLTIKNLWVPYVTSASLNVQGDENPTLTLEPGVILLFPRLAGLMVGFNKPGTLVADATNASGQPSVALQGKLDQTWSGDYKKALETGASLANAKNLKQPSALWPTNQAIVLGPVMENPTKGSWFGVHFGRSAGNGSKLTGVVVNWAGGVRDDTAAVLADGANVQFAMEKSMVANSANVGFRMYQSSFSSFSGNFITGHTTPMQIFPDAAGTIGAGNDFTGNEADWILVLRGEVTKTQTWLNPGVPYYLSSSVSIGGNAKPVLTLSPGTTVVSSSSGGIYVGDSGAVGSLVAVGTADKPITFTSELERPGTWNGLVFGTNSGKGNKVENAQVTYAKIGLVIKPDIGSFLKNVTISNNSEYGIYRSYNSSGTDFTKEPTIRFESNAKDQR